MHNKNKAGQNKIIKRKAKEHEGKGGGGKGVAKCVQVCGGEAADGGQRA